jgi:hypothetical protein
MAIWTPAEIDPLLWLDAADPSTITIDTGISQQNDKSGNAYNAIQSTATNQPVLTVGGMAGLDTASFDSSDDFLTISDTAGLQFGTGDFGIIVVASVVNANKGDTKQNTLIGKNYTGFELAQYEGLVHAYVGGASNKAVSAAGAVVNNTPFLAGVSRVSGSLTVSVNGVSGLAVANSGNASQVGTNVYIGQRAGGTSTTAMGGNISEITVLPPSFTIDDVQHVEGYLAWKWGLEANLPAGHPYELAAPTIDGLLLRRASFDQLYELLPLLLRSIHDQLYSLQFRLAALLDQIYGLRLLVKLDQLYSNAPRRRARIDQIYSDAAKLRKQFDQRYGNNPKYRTAIDQLYKINAGLRAAMDQNYSIADGQVRAVLAQLSDLQDAELVRMTLDMLYVLAAGEALVQRTEQAVYCSGVEHTSAYNIMIEQDESLFYMVGELQLADEAEFFQYRPFETDVVIEVDERQYHFIVDAAPRRSRQPGENVFVVPLVSKTVLLDSPHSVVDSENLSGMAADLVAVLAAPFIVDWQLVNWFIPPNILQGNGESAISIIKRIVAAAGGLVQTSPAGVLVCRPEYPVSVNEWSSAAPAFELTDQDDFFSIDPSPDPRPGYNVFFLTNQSLASDGVSLDIVQRSATENELRVLMLPWSDTARVIMHHSGGSWVQVIDQGIVIETIEEQVEIVAGAGQTTKPVFAYVDHKYSVVDLGAVEVAEAGNVTTELADNSLLQLTYQTRYWSFLATDPNIEDVQFFPEIIES